MWLKQQKLTYWNSEAGVSKIKVLADGTLVKGLLPGLRWPQLLSVSSHGEYRDAAALRSSSFKGTDPIMRPPPL